MEKNAEWAFFLKNDKKLFLSPNFRVYKWTGANAMIIVTRFQNKQQMIT